MILEAGSLRSRCQHGWVLVSALFWVVGCQLLLVFPCGGRGQGKFLRPFIRTLIPFMRTLASWPIHLPKSPPPNTITLGVRILTYEFVRDVNIQTIVPFLWSSGSLCPDLMFPQRKVLFISYLMSWSQSVYCSPPITEIII